MSWRELEDLCLALIFILGSVVLIVCMCQALAEYTARGW